MRRGSQFIVVILATSNAIKGNNSFNSIRAGMFAFEHSKIWYSVQWSAIFGCQQFDRRKIPAFIFLLNFL
jgi:hypothetical protein